MKIDRLIRITALVSMCLVGFGVTHPALAQEPPGTRPTPCHLATPNNAICIMWTAPATNTDGTPIVLPISYRLERQSGASWVPVITTDLRQHYLTGLTPGTYTFRVSAIVNGAQSDYSNTASRDATAPPPPVPQPPVIQVVQVTIGVDHAPVFTVLADGSRSTTVGGFAAVGTECRGPVLFRYRNKDYREPAAWKPWNTSTRVRVAAPCA